MMNLGTSFRWARLASNASFGTTAPWLPLLLVVAVLFSALPTWAAVSLDDQYLKIVSTIEEADTAVSQSKPAVAKPRYEWALGALTAMKRDYPSWNARAVTFRLKYVNDKLAALTAKPVEATPEAPKTEAKPQAKAASLPSGTALKLISGGSEPRKPLRFQPKAGDKQSLTISMTSTMGMGMADAAPQMMKLPIMKLVVTETAKGVNAEGDIDYETTIDDTSVEGAVGVEASMTEAMKDSLKGVKGLRILATMTDRGVNKKAEPQVAANADATTRVAAEQIKEVFAGTEMLLPHEAIGVGAKWEVRQKIKEEGMTIDQTATHTLASVEGNVITIKSVIAQTAAPGQKIPNPMLPGSTVDLVKLTATGTATTKMDLTRISPTESTTEDHTTRIFAMDVGGQKQNSTMKSDTIILVEAK